MFHEAEKMSLQRGIFPMFWLLSTSLLMATNCPNFFIEWAYPQGVRVSGTHTGQACGVTQVTGQSRGGHFKSP